MVAVASVAIAVAAVIDASASCEGSSVCGKGEFGGRTGSGGGVGAAEADNGISDVDAAGGGPANEEDGVPGGF